MMLLSSGVSIAFAANGDVLSVVADGQISPFWLMTISNIGVGGVMIWVYTGEVKRNTKREADHKERELKLDMMSEKMITTTQQMISSLNAAISASQRGLRPDFSETQAIRKE